MNVTILIDPRCTNAAIQATQSIRCQPSVFSSPWPTASSITLVLSVIYKTQLLRLWSPQSLQWALSSTHLLPVLPRQIRLSTPFSNCHLHFQRNLPARLLDLQAHSITHRSHQLDLRNHRRPHHLSLSWKIPLHWYWQSVLCLCPLSSPRRPS